MTPTPPSHSYQHRINHLVMGNRINRATKLVEVIDGGGEGILISCSGIGSKKIIKIIIILTTISIIQINKMHEIINFNI